MREIITVVGTSPTIFISTVADYRVVVRESASFIDGTPGGYVRRWALDGSAVQAFGSWTGSYGGAMHWPEDAVDPEDKARRIARDLRIPYVEEADFAAWRAKEEARMVRGDIYFLSSTEEYGDRWEEIESEEIPQSSWLQPKIRLGYWDVTGKYAVTLEDTGARDLPARYTLQAGGQVVATVDRPAGSRDTVSALAAAFQAAVAAARAVPAPQAA